MADISMCLNMDCPLRLKCYRFTAVRNDYRQSYGAFIYTVDEKGENAKCEFYWDNTGYEKREDIEDKV